LVSEPRHSRIITAPAYLTNTTWSHYPAILVL
jgi:hypothetical protein